MKRIGILWFLLFTLVSLVPYAFTASDDMKMTGPNRQALQALVTNPTKIVNKTLTGTSVFANISTSGLGGYLQCHDNSGNPLPCKFSYESSATPSGTAVPMMTGGRDVVRPKGITYLRIGNYGSTTTYVTFEEHYSPNE